jgi:hypothetical protein
LKSPACSRISITIAKIIAVAQHRTPASRHRSFSKRVVDALTAGLQKVSAQLEVSKSTPQTVLNDQ